MSSAFPLVIMLWIVGFLASCCAPVVAAIRRGPGAAVRALLAPLGAALSFALISAGIGVLESNWGAGDLVLWAVVGVGVLGVVLAVAGWRVALRRRIPAGFCQACGHPLLSGAERCSECGRYA